jgi:hypothetical protein
MKQIFVIVTNVGYVTWTSQMIARSSLDGKARPLHQMPLTIHDYITHNSFPLSFAFVTVHGAETRHPFTHGQEREWNGKLFILISGAEMFLPCSYGLDWKRVVHHVACIASASDKDYGLISTIVQASKSRRTPLFRGSRLLGYENVLPAVAFAGGSHEKASGMDAFPCSDFFAEIFETTGLVLYFISYRPFCLVHMIFVVGDKRSHLLILRSHSIHFWLRRPDLGLRIS